MGKNVLIAGITSEIGKNLAIEFFKKKYRVIGTTRSDIKKLISNSNYIQLNNFNYNDLPQLLKKYDFEIFANCIGSYSKNDFSSLNDKIIKDLYNSNLILPSSLIIKVFKNFSEKNKGTIVNINSVAALEAKIGNEIIYSSSKSGLKSLIESLQLQVKNDKLNINLIDVYSGAFQSQMTINRKDYDNLINTKELSKFLVMHLIKNNSFMIDKINIKRNKY